MSNLTSSLNLNGVLVTVSNLGNTQWGCANAATQAEAERVADLMRAAGFRPVVNFDPLFEDFLVEGGR